MSSGEVVSNERAVWRKVFGLLLLATSAWALSLPLMTGPDEAPQAIRAAAVVRGQLTGDNPDVGNARVYVEVPEAYAEADRAGRCFLGQARELWHEWMVSRTPRDECPEMGGGRSNVEAPTTQHRGQPVYYFLLGLPSLLFSGSAGPYTMRLIGAVICSALIASAFLSALQLRAGRLAALATWVSVTPVVLYLAGVINPAAIEVSAALGAWLAGLGLVRGAGLPDRRLVVRFGAALVVLTLTRGLSPVFAVALLGVLAGLASPDRRRMLAGRKDVRVALGGALTATLASGLWLAYVNNEFPLRARTGVGLSESLGEVGWWLRSTVAVFGSTDVVPPVALHFGWLGLILAAASFAWAAGLRRDLVVGTGVFASGLVLLVSGHGFNLPDIGYWWQGRYVLPLLVGALPVAVSGAGALEARLQSRLTRFGPWVMGIAVVLHLWAFLYATRHYTVGFSGPANPGEFLLAPDWEPRYGSPLLWAAAFVTSLSVAAVVIWRAASVADRETSDSSDNEASAGPGRSGDARTAPAMGEG